MNLSEKTPARLVQTGQASIPGFKPSFCHRLVLGLSISIALHSAAAADHPMALTTQLNADTVAQAERQSLGDGIAAIINNDVITRRELLSRVQLATQQLTREKVSAPPRAVLERQVLERLVMEHGQLIQANELGLKIDDGQVDRALSRLAEQNRLTLEQLRDRVEKQGVAFRDYREDVRLQMLVSKLREREVDSKIQVSEAEVDGFLAEQRGEPAGSQEWRLAQLLIRLPEGASPARVAELRAKAESLLNQIKSGADFAKIAAEHSDGAEALQGGDMGWRFQERWPQLFMQAVATLKPGEVSNVIQSPNGFHVIKLVAKRAATEAAAAMPQVRQTQVRHILLKPNEVLSSAEAQKRLAALRERILSGAISFEDAARQYSNDPSAPQGGALGWVYPGDTVPEFEAVMNSLSAGEISPPVQTPFGWHLITVADRRVQDVSVDRLRMAARATLRERKADEAYEQWLQQLRDRLYVEIRLDPVN